MVGTEELEDRLQGDRFFLGAYWKGREESIGVCSVRLTNMFMRLSELNDGFSRVSTVTSSDHYRSRRSILLTREDIEELLLKGAQRLAGAGGFYMRIATHPQGAGDVTISTYVGSRYRGVPNSITMHFSRWDWPWGSCESRKLLLAVVEPNDAQWGLITSAHLAKAAGIQQLKPSLGWINYVKVNSSTLASCLSSARVDSAGKHASIITTHDGKLSATDPNQVAALVKLNDEIREGQIKIPFDPLD